MPENKPTARRIAVRVLDRLDVKKGRAGQILNKLLEQTGEKQRATDLVMGVIRNRQAIDILLKRLAGRPAERVQPKVVNIIRVGIYELVYCTAAEHAIVNEAVEAARTVAGRKQVGFVNAVLRSIERHIVNRDAQLNKTRPRRTLPRTYLTGCEFDVDILPAPDEDLATFLSEAFSLPAWLVGRWFERFGEEKAKRICFASNRRPGVYIRANTLRTSFAELCELLAKEGVEYEKQEGEGLIRLNKPHALSGLPGYAQGHFSVQDMAASKAVKMLRPGQDSKILDLCAAPGTKTVQLAEIINDKGLIFATDIDAKRLKMVTENIERLDIKSVCLFPYAELEKMTKKAGLFDAVLLDVPCSNTAVMARRPEVRYRITKKAIKGLAKIQIKLLEYGAALVKENGKICYSTCSIEDEENARLLEQFLKNNHGFELKDQILTLPSAQMPDHDGGYVAILEKKHCPRKSKS